jgi:WD40 repeat protein/serine/threonine protein kinase
LLHADATAPAEQLLRLWRQGQQPDVREFLTRFNGLSPRQLAAVLRVDQAQRARLGQPVAVESYLADFSAVAVNREAALDLIYGEFMLREERGEAPSRDDYCARFPEHAATLRQQLDLHAVMQELGTDSPVTRMSGPVDPYKAPTLLPASAASAFSNGPGAAAERTPFIPGYEVVEELGRGGMGVVYKAWQTALKRPVALKMILGGSHAGPQELARFRTEAEAVARLQHSNIIQIYEVGKQAGVPFCSLEFCPGGSLAAKLDGTPLPARQAAELVATLARAVHAAHQVGIIHRDLKPANVLLAADGTPKITDFGLAKCLQSEPSATGGPPVADAPGSPAHTQTGAVLGTPSYMAPEQAGGKPGEVGPAADTYALGAILYELLTGRPPFKAATPLETVLQVVTDEPVPPVRLQPCTPRDLDTICLKCLQKQPAKRYASALDLAEDLRRFLASEPIKARRTSAAERFARWVWRKPLVASLTAAVAALLILTITVLAISNVQSNREQELIKEQQQQTEAALRQERQTSYFQTIALAERQLAANNVSRAEELLDACPEHLRGWEWHYLKRRRYQQPVPLRGHSDWVLGVAFSADGRLLASGSFRYGVGGFPWGEIKLWDRETHKELRTLSGLSGHLGPVTSLAFTPDGKRLASAGWDGKVKLWNVATGHLLHTLGRHRKYVNSVAISADGRRLASGSGDRTVMIWDPSTGKLLLTLKGHTGGVYSVAFHPDSKRLASGSSDGTVKIWDATAARVLHTFSPRKGLIQTVAFSRDGQFLAAGGIDGMIRLWDVPSGRLIHTLPNSVALVSSVAFSRDGKRLAAGSFEKAVKIWDVASGQEIVTLGGQTDAVMSVAFSPDGDLLASGSLDRTVMLWDATPLVANDDQATLTLRGHSALITNVAFSPDGKRLASAGFDGAVILWDLATREKRFTFAGNDGPVYGLAFGRDQQHGQRLASGSLGGTIQVRDVSTGKDVYTQHAYAGIMALSSDGRRLVSTEEGAIVQVTDTTTGKVVHRFQAHQATIQGVAYSPGGQYFATASWDQTVKLWNAKTGRAVRTFQGHRHVVHNVVFSRDGRRLASASWDHTAKVWDVSTGKAICTLQGHKDRVMTVAFSPNARLVATAAGDNTVKIWDATTGKELHTFAGHTGFVMGVAFSPDGKRLATASGYRGKGEVKIWDLTQWHLETN